MKSLFDFFKVSFGNKDHIAGHIGHETVRLYNSNQVSFNLYLCLFINSHLVALLPLAFTEFIVTCAKLIAKLQLCAQSCNNSTSAHINICTLVTQTFLVVLSLFIIMVDVQKLLCTDFFYF